MHFQTLFNNKTNTRQSQTEKFAPSVQHMIDVQVLIFIAQQNLVRIDAVALGCYALALMLLKNMHNAPLSPLHENMMSSSKLEVYNIS